MIEVKDLTVMYPDGTKAVHEVNFTLNDGECVALIGANGAGKSTLLLSLVNVVKKAEGEIIVDGVSLSKKTTDEIRQKIGMVFQNPDNQLFMTSVMDDVAFGPRNYGMSEPEVMALVDETLKSLGIEHLKCRMPHRLSGGEKRSVALASVLSMKPSCVLFDEPSSFLDPKAKRLFVEMMSELSCTKLIATHDLEMAKTMCPRTIVLQYGHIKADGNTNEILNNTEFLNEVGLI